MTKRKPSNKTIAKKLDKMQGDLHNMLDTLTELYYAYQDKEEILIDGKQNEKVFKVFTYMSTSAKLIEDSVMYNIGKAKEIIDPENWANE